MSVISVSDRPTKISSAAGYWGSVALFCLQTVWLGAQSGISFEASVSSKEIIVGTPFEITFTLKNADGARFTPPSFSGFRSGGISEMRGMSIVNGKSSTSQSWSVDLTPTQPGTFTIGPATVTAGRQTLSTRPLTLTVIPLSASSKGNIKVPPGADDKIFIAADFDRKTAFTGQQLRWRVRVYTQVAVEGYDIIALPSFEDCYTREKIRFDKRPEYLTIKGKRYAVQTLHEEAIFPQKAGTLTIGPARISVGIEQSGAQGFFFGPKPVTLQTQPVSIEVSSPPGAAPETFTGGVGQYEWTVVADTNTLSTDDALTVFIEIKGNGDARRFAAPKLIVPPACEVFEPRILDEEEYESETEVLHRKKFEYVVLPKDTGYQEIAPVLACFDPDSNRYVLLNAVPLRFRIVPGKNYQPKNAAPLNPPAEPIAGASDGFWQKLQAGLRSPWFWALLLAPLLFVLLYRSVKRKQPELALQPAVAAPMPVVPPPAVSAAPVKLPGSNERRLADVAPLLNGSQPGRFYDELFKYLQYWLASRLQLTPAQMNEQEVSEALRRFGATPIRAQALFSVWHTCEQAIYGGQASEAQMEPTYRLTEQLIEALEKEIRR